MDLGHMRWNLALDYGIQAAEQFLAIYRTLTAGAVRHHPYWDVVTVIDLIGIIDPDDTPCPAATSLPWKPTSLPRWPTCDQPLHLRQASTAEVHC